MAYWDPVKNFAKVIVNGLYDDAATSITLLAGEGNKLPDPSTDGSFNMVWWNATDYSDPSDDPYREIVRVTAKSGDVLTIQRGQENTTAQPHNIPGKTYKMMIALTEKTYTDLQKIVVFQDGTFVGQRPILDFLSPFSATDDSVNNKLVIYPPARFGGDGSDGDLVITAGTTTLDLGGQKIFVKNYNNLEISGTGQLNFINPHNDGTLIIFRVKGDCKITSTNNPVIDLRNLGGLGGNPSRGFYPWMRSFWKLYKINTLDFIIFQGWGGFSGVNMPPFLQTNNLFLLDIQVISGSAFIIQINEGYVSATGGRGGGALIIEVGGNFIGNSSSIINASGSPGGSANWSTSSVTGLSTYNYEILRGFSFSPFHNWSSSYDLRQLVNFIVPGSGGLNTDIKYAGASSSGTVYGGGGGGGSVLILVNGTITGSLTFDVSGGTSGAGAQYNGADGIGLILKNKWFL
ncbi:MAG: hypothetical protein KatS3mg096_746 [Candidatus Parcubacteria bacterium]|nr:MAG: hypothetical protein KatS3mg096_746 [Candidatus Parcubacteria bacterium]